MRKWSSHGNWYSCFWFMGFMKVVAPCFCEQGPHKSRKNNCISRTMQTGLVPLRCWQPAHSNDINIVGLICSLGCPQRKTTKIYCLIFEGETHSTFSDTLQHPRQLQQQTSGMQQQGLVASWWCKNLAAGCFKEGTGNDVQKCMIHSRLWNVSDSHVKLF